MTSRQFYEFLKSAELNNEFETFFLNSNQSDTRLHCLKTFMKTEFNYLSKIRDLLIVVFELSEKITARTIINKAQLELLYQNLPLIFQLHYNLHWEIRKNLTNFQGIGKILLSFLLESRLLEVYLNYVNCCADYLKLCQNVKLNERCTETLKLNSLEAVIMMPIQRFPQLQLVIGDLYKNTPDYHDDKVFLFKSIYCIKSISMSLDQRQKYIESSDINDMLSFLRRFRINFKSSKVISKTSVFYLKPDFNIPRKIIRLPYFIVLCDEEVIIYPRDVCFNEIPFDMIFYYSLNDININIKNIFGFSHPKNGRLEFEKAKELFPLIRDSLINNEIIEEVEKILHDHQLIVKIYEDIGRLNFSYSSLEQLKISKTLLELENKLCERERELNNYFDTIINLKIKKSDKYRDEKLFQFDSSRLSNIWKGDFCRTKCSFRLNRVAQWIPIAVTKRYMLTQNHHQEFPLSFNPFFLSSSGIPINNMKIEKFQIITITIGTKVCRCLWLSMSDGSVIILHFNYIQWSVLEKFQTNIRGPINAICNFSVLDLDLVNEPLDHEIWIGFEDQILSFPLKTKDHSVEKFRLKFSSEVRTICQVNDKMLVGLQSFEILVYSQNDNSKWSLEKLVNLKKDIKGPNELLQNSFYGSNKFYYVIFDNNIVIIKPEEYENQPECFISSNKISCFHYSSDGIWLCTKANLTLTMYDFNLKMILQTLTIPITFFGQNTVDSITSILLTEKNLWIGTEAGYIIIITTIDRLCCNDARVTTYLNSKFSSGSINYLFRFHNPQGIQIKTHYLKRSIKGNISDLSGGQLKRSSSTPEKIDSLPSQDVTDFKKLTHTYDNFTSYDALESIKINTPFLTVAIGDGLLQFEDFVDYRSKYPEKKSIRPHDQLIFTFLE